VLVTYRTPPVRPRPPFPERRSSSRRRQALALAIGAVAAVLATGPAGADPVTLASKQSQASAVLAQVRQIDASLEHAVEAYNLANVKLQRIQRDVQRNRFELAVAQTNLGKAEDALSSRVVAIYTSDQANSTLEILLGAESLEDLLNRIEAVNRVSQQDGQVIGEVRAFRADLRRARAQLRRARAEQEQVVEARASEKSRIEAQLARRQALLSTIRGEIARLRAEEAARQARLARQVQARMPVQPIASGGLGIAASSPDGATVAPPSRYGGVIGIAMQYLGTPYRWGGASPGGFDCSGFVMYVFSRVGVSLPHNAAAQYGYGVPVSRDQLQAGDLVFFNGLGHNGIYIGSGQFIHSPHTGDFVKISSLSDSWYASTYVGARRL
jgi:peptidoglycan DL-endopeptidase CwlO